MNIDFTWIGGATFIITIDELKMACDPVLCSKGTKQDYFWFTSKRLENPVYSESDFENVDIWFITHNHNDHLDDKGLSYISNTSQIVCNSNSSKKLLKKGIKNLSILTWKEVKTFKIKDFDIEIETIPAVHGVNPLSAFFAGKGNGYFVKITKGFDVFSFYITGDTVYKNVVMDALKGKNINLLIPNMGAAKSGTWIMTLTLNAKMLNAMILKTNPKLIIPVHFGTFEHYNESIDKILDLNNPKIKILQVWEQLNINNFNPTCN